MKKINILRTLLLSTCGFTSNQGLSVYIPQRITNGLVAIYSTATKEIPLCAMGKKINDVYVITDIKIPFISFSTSDSARFDNSNCGPDYLGMWHNHRGSLEYCMASDVDMRRFIRDDRAQLELISCNFTDSSLTTAIFFKELMPDSIRAKYGPR